MRRIIDAHVHIVPERLLGTTEGAIHYDICGRYVIAGGKMHYQAMPDIIGNSAFTAQTLVRVMENAGVERGIIMQGMSDALLPDTIAAVRRYPDQLWGAMRLDPAADNLGERVKLYHSMGLTVIKCLLEVIPGFPNRYEKNPINSPAHREAFALAQEYGITVAIDPGMPGNAGYNVEGIENVIRDFPRLRFVLCHLAVARKKPLEDPRIHALWAKMRSLAAFPNVWLECSALCDFYEEERYPYPTAQRLVREAMDEFGANKVIWGSDIPGTLTNSTYRQLIETYDRSALFTEEEKDRLFSQNALDAYGQN